MLFERIKLTVVKSVARIGGLIDQAFVRAGNTPEARG
jgi:hypothetical protein